MSTLIDRRAHQVPNERPQVWADSTWHDFALTILFGAVGIAVTAAVLIAGIPLTGPDIFNG
ncbi:MAG TPA: hypothetical protein VFW46_17275 [Stellaceae bacterium]|nr:hypothetical protein [Stellaceae bacterium]